MEEGKVKTRFEGVKIRYFSKMWETFFVGLLIAGPLHGMECRDTIERLIEIFPATTEPSDFRKLTEQVIATQDPLLILSFATKIAEINFSDRYLPDPAMNIFLSFNMLVDFAGNHSALEFEIPIDSLRQKLSWYYFHSMRRAPTTWDAMDYHASMEEVVRVGLKFQKLVEERKRLKEGIDAEYKE